MYIHALVMFLTGIQWSAGLEGGRVIALHAECTR